MYVCMYVYMYIYMYVCVCVCVCVCIVARQKRAHQKCSDKNAPTKAQSNY